MVAEEATPPQRTDLPTKRALARRLVGFAAQATLLYVAWAGARGFVRQWPRATDAGQLLQTCSELWYSVTALLCVLTPWFAPRWAVVVRRGFVVGVVLAGGLAPTAWGGAPPWVGAITSVASLITAAGLVGLLGWSFPRGEKVT